MIERISSLDPGYVDGMLSNYPIAIDTYDSLYLASNNAETTLSQGLAFTGRQVIVNDASMFPPSGLLKLAANPMGKTDTYEIIYYANRTDQMFMNLVRGFAGSVQNKWPTGTAVTNSVFAEHHNAEKDAVIQIENYVGTSIDPTATSLNGVLNQLEIKYLSPNATFRAFPLTGPPPLAVTFQNFSPRNVIRYLWDFGDGAQSFDRSPIHTYQAEGVYTITLNIIGEFGGFCAATKNNYVTVSDNGRIPFFYVTQVDPTKPAYSVETAAQLNPTNNPNGAQPCNFLFVDQTEGNVVRRLWVFDDGDVENVSNPNIHTTTHEYQSPGTYNPSVLVEFSTNNPQRVFLQEPLIVL